MCHRPKFKQHILSLYPQPGDENPEEPKNVDNLVYYANLYPKTLPKIGKYLLKILARDAAKGRLRFVLRAARLLLNCFPTTARPRLA